MSKAPKSRNHLTITTDKGTIELTEKELSRVAGGLKLDDVKAASIYSKHDGTL